MSRALYVHFPFCLKKCEYCDFVSYSDKYELEDAYIHALLQEMEQFRGSKIKTVYFGGGTPTSLATDSLLRVAEFIQTAFCVEKNCEFTVECNPKTADGDTFYALKQVGVNRVSIGVQSLCNGELAVLGRIHNEDDAVCAVETAQNAGGLRVSADVMFGIPGQSVNTLRESLCRILQTGISHISCYDLILEENTPLYRRVCSGEVRLPDEDSNMEMFDVVARECASFGLQQYEISNFARVGEESRHNLCYWNAEEYFGFGAGAAGYINGVRYTHTADVAAYIQNPFLQKEQERVSLSESMAEFMILGLRKTVGVEKQAFVMRYQKPLGSVFGDVIQKHVRNGLLEDTATHVRFTPRGLLISNTVLCDFM